uniref:Sialidase n=1 Tax=Lygus hesperus TaxID=30085 RepID=A0A0A9XJ59_LYGHE
MSRFTLAVSTVTILASVLTSIGYTAGQCPSTETGQLRYIFYPSVTQDFTLCTSNLTASYDCPNGFVYKPRSSIYDYSPLCTFRRAGRFTFDCRQNGNGSYSGDVTLYATCANGNAIAVNECPKGMNFMKKTRSCEMGCLNVGIFGVSEQEYYTCTYDYKKYRYTMKSEKCPPDTEFLDDYDVCLVDGNSIPTPPSSTPSGMTTVFPSNSSSTSENPFFSPTESSSVPSIPTDIPLEPTTYPTDSSSFSTDSSSPTDSSSSFTTDLPTDSTSSGSPTIPAVHTDGTTSPSDMTSEPTPDHTYSSSTPTESSSASPTDVPTYSTSGSPNITTTAPPTTTTTEPSFPWGQ